jgi:hypothetical protein
LGKRKARTIARAGEVRIVVVPFTVEGKRPAIDTLALSIRQLCLTAERRNLSSAGGPQHIAIALNTIMLVHAAAITSNSPRRSFRSIQRLAPEEAPAAVAHGGG